MPPKKARARRRKHAHQSAHSMSAKELILSNFQALDSDHNGTLTMEELSALLRKGDPNMADSTIKKLFVCADHDEDGLIEFEEFVEFIFKVDTDLKKQYDREQEEKEKIMAATMSTKAWKRASSDARVHDRLGPISGVFTFDISGGEGNASWKEAHKFVLNGEESGYQYELTMFERMGTRTDLDKKESGVWEVSSTQPEVILHNVMANPRERHLEVLVDRGKIVGVKLHASRPVELELQSSL